MGVNGDVPYAVWRVETDVVDLLFWSLPDWWLDTIGNIQASKESGEDVRSPP